MKKNNTQKKHNKKKIVEVSFGKKGNRQSIKATDFSSYSEFQRERKSVYKYGYNPRDIRK